MDKSLIFDPMRCSEHLGRQSGTIMYTIFIISVQTMRATGQFRKWINYPLYQFALDCWPLIVFNSIQAGNQGDANCQLDIEQIYSWFVLRRDLPEVALQWILWYTILNTLVNGRYQICVIHSSSEILRFKDSRIFLVFIIGWSWAPCSRNCECRTSTSSTPMGNMCARWKASIIDLEDV